MREVTLGFACLNTHKFNKISGLWQYTERLRRGLLLYLAAKAVEVKLFDTVAANPE